MNVAAFKHFSLFGDKFLAEQTRMRSIQQKTLHLRREAESDELSKGLWAVKMAMSISRNPTFPSPSKGQGALSPQAA